MVSPIQIWSFMAAMRDLYVKAGGQLLSMEEIEKRFTICQTCEHFTGRGCKLCGCCSNQRRTLFNKLAYPTEDCPDGRWSAGISINSDAR